ncbi:MAG: hypothetical protein FJY98_02785 [Candidatus Liptonbacteria bacterium]|nr:hypothetical protein [Candidatus Liptonbacteria bacterium]
MFDAIEWVVRNIFIGMLSLQKIRNTIGCGKVWAPNKTGSVRYSVQDMNDLQQVIIPFFEKYQLHAQKRLDFDLWKEAVYLLNKNKGRKTNINSTGNPRGTRKLDWNPNDLFRLKQIHEEMKSYKGGNRGNWKWEYKMS